jgi:hypothetical protein
VETAIPISKESVISSLKKIEEMAKVEDTEEKRDKSIASLANTPGWQELKKTVESRITELNELSNAIEGNESVETIGFKFLAAKAAVAHLQAIINLVEGSEQYVREAKREDGERT